MLGVKVEVKVEKVARVLRWFLKYLLIGCDCFRIYAGSRISLVPLTRPTSRPCAGWTVT